MEYEAIAVRRKHEGNLEGRCVIEGLLHAIADAVVIVLGLDDRDRDVRLVVENEVGLLGFATADKLAANDDAAFGEIDLLADLQQIVPAGALKRGQDEFRADIAFGEPPLVHFPLPFNSLSWLE